MENQSQVLTNQDFVIIISAGKQQPEVVAERQAARKTGKRTLNVCCQSTANIIVGALEIGLNEDQLQIFLSAFKSDNPIKGHQYELRNWSKQIGNRFWGRKKYFIDEFVEKQFEFAELLEDEALGAYFLKSISEVIEAEAKKWNDNDQTLAVLTVKKALKQNSIKPDTRQVENHLVDTPSSPHPKKPKMAEVALFYRYIESTGEGDCITVANRDNIAKKHGFVSPTSGQKLYDRYNSYNSANQRTAKTRYTVKNLENVIQRLSTGNYPKALKKAEDELKIAQGKNLK